MQGFLFCLVVVVVAMMVDVVGLGIPTSKTCQTNKRIILYKSIKRKAAAVVVPCL